MAVNKNNGLAYDLSLFEPETTKKKNKKQEPKTQAAESKVIRLDQDAVEKSQKRKRNPVIILGVSLLTTVVAAVSALIVYNNVLINELNEKIISANDTIVNQNNLEAQYQLKIDSKLTNEKVQEYAENKLGMTKANTAQKEFVSLTDGDKGEVVQGEENDSFFVRVGRFLHLI